MNPLTNLIFEPKGKHDSASAYDIKDTVMSADGSRVYFALQDVPVGIPLDDEDYWKLQIDLSASKSAMDDAIASFGNYAKAIGTRVKGEIGKANGNPVTFLPDADSLLMPVTVLEPQQEGSGDPYPAGGGKNLLNNTATTQTLEGVTFTVNSDGIVTANGTASADAILIIDRPVLPAGEYIASGCPAYGDASSRHSIYFGLSNAFDYGIGHRFTLTKETQLDYVRIIIRNGYTASNLVFKPMIRLASDTDASYAPYENIRPISGYNTLGLTRDGKNLAYLTYRDMVPSVGSGYDVSAYGWASDYIPIDGSGAWVLSVSEVNTNAAEDEILILFLYDKDKNFIGFKQAASTVSMSIVANEISGYENAKYCRLRLSAIINTPTRLQFELGSTATPFAPYQGKTHTVQIGQTVYGLRYEWLTGKGWIEWGGRIMSETDNWNMTGSVFYQPLPENIDTTKSMCSHYGFSPSTVNNASSVGKYDLLGSIRFNKGNFNTVDEWKSNLSTQKAAGTPVQVIWKLKTPIEIQLPSTIISAADPEQTNTLYGDGSIEVEYIKPLHVSIEERVAAALAAMHE